MENDLTSAISPDVAMTTQAITTDTTTVGAIIDSKGFESLDFSVLSGTLTDGDYVALLEDGEDSSLSDAATVATDFIIGTLPVFALSDDDTVKHVGYVGKKRYVRLSLVSTNVTTGGTLSSVATKGHPKTRPTS